MRLHSIFQCLPRALGVKSTLIFLAWLIGSSSFLLQPPVFSTPHPEEAVSWSPDSPNLHPPWFFTYCLLDHPVELSWVGQDGMALDQGPGDCHADHRKSTPEGPVVPTTEQRLLCTSDQKEVENLPGRAAGPIHPAYGKSTCTPLHCCFWAPRSGGQQLFWGRGGQEKSRCMWKEMAMGKLMCPWCSD